MNDDFIPHEPSYTVDEFCKAERISRVKLYELWKRGDGPRHYFNGRCRRITHAARMEWQREMESRAETQAQRNSYKPKGGTSTPVGKSAWRAHG